MTDTIDGYIQKVKQVAALLDYGDPQILELFKNTLPSRLYYMLYHIDNLRKVVEMAKRILTKEQMDKKAGLSSTSPFMQVNQNSSKSKDKMEKKVSFSAVEAMERTKDSIERLPSLMDRMYTKLDRRADQYRPRVHQGRTRGCGYRQNNYGSRNRSYSWDHYQNSHRGRRNYSNRGGNRNYRSNYKDDSRSRDRNSYRDGNWYNIDQTTEEMIVIKGMVIEVKITVDLGTEIGEIGLATGKVPNPGVDPKTATKVEGRVETIPDIETGLGLDQDPLLTVADPGFDQGAGAQL